MLTAAGSCYTVISLSVEMVCLSCVPPSRTMCFAVDGLQVHCSELKIQPSTTFNIASVDSGRPKWQLPNAAFLPKISRVGSHLPRRHLPSLTEIVNGRRDHPSTAVAGSPLVTSSYPRRATQPVLGRKGKVANVPVQHLPSVPGPGCPTVCTI